VISGPSYFMIADLPCPKCNRDMSECECEPAGGDGWLWATAAVLTITAVSLIF
jgi:hypothetical protein